MRINKFLAEQGVASRRGADELVAEGRVTINGKTAKAGDDVGADDAVMLDGKLLSHKVKYEYYILNKPKGYLCTVSDDKGRKTVMDLLPAGAGRVVPVGRLDYDTEGLLILTNDGDLAYRLTAPQNEIPKTYLVETDKAYTKLHVTLTEGKNREIRKMFEAVGKSVAFLKRIKVGELTLTGLDRGACRKLTQEEVFYLKNL